MTRLSLHANKPILQRVDEGQVPVREREWVTKMNENRHRQGATHGMTFTIQVTETPDGDRNAFTAKTATELTNDQKIAQEAANISRRDIGTHSAGSTVVVH